MYELAPKHSHRCDSPPRLPHSPSVQSSIVPLWPHLSHQLCPPVSLSVSLFAILPSPSIMDRPGHPQTRGAPVEMEPTAVDKVRIPSRLCLAMQ